MCIGHRRGEQVPAVASAARAGSLQGKMSSRRLRARARGRLRELVPLAAAARARSALTNAKPGLAWAVAGRAAAGGAGKGGLGTREVQAAAGQRMRREERAAVSGRRQKETRGGAAEGESEQEGRRRGNASTIGKGVNARSAEGGASASTSG